MVTLKPVGYSSTKVYCAVAAQPTVCVTVTTYSPSCVALIVEVVPAIGAPSRVHEYCGPSASLQAVNVFVSHSMILSKARSVLVMFTTSVVILTILDCMLQVPLPTVT